MPTTSQGWAQAIAGIEIEIATSEQRHSTLVSERAGLRLRARFGSASAKTRIAGIDAELKELQPRLDDAVMDRANALQRKAECEGAEASTAEQELWKRIADKYAERDAAATKADAALAAGAEAVRAARACQIEIQALLPPPLRDNYILGRDALTRALYHYGFGEFADLGPASFTGRDPYAQTLQAWTRTQPAPVRAQ
jgi:hypothetical protein